MPTHETAVPPDALIAPTLMITGRSAKQAYAQPGPQLDRLAKAGAILRIAHGYYVAVPIDKRDGGWTPSLDALTAGLATAVYGSGRGVVWGLSAARLHGALPRAMAIGYAFGPAQHRRIYLLDRVGRVEFRKRDPERLDVEYLSTEVGPGLVTTIEQTVLDLSGPDLENDEVRAGAVRNLVGLTSLDDIADLAARVRGGAAFARARKLVS